MKKVIIPSIIVVIVLTAMTLAYFLLFKTDKMICTSNTNDDFRTTKETIEVYYKDNDVKKIVQDTKHTFNDTQAKRTFKDFLDNAYTNIKEIDHTTASKNDEGLVYETTVTIKANKLDDIESNSLSVSDNLEQLQNILDINGFECKIEK